MVSKFYIEPTVNFENSIRYRSVQCQRGTFHVRLASRWNDAYGNEIIIVHISINSVKR